LPKKLVFLKSRIFVCVCVCVCVRERERERERECVNTHTQKEFKTITINGIIISFKYCAGYFIYISSLKK
jgi:hypothetical protein